MRQRLYSSLSRLVYFMILSLLLSTTTFSSTPTDQTLAPMLKKVLPAIVNIKAQIKTTDPKAIEAIKEQRRHHPEAPNKKSDIITSIASGVIIDSENGYIVTNAHVINNAETITVTLGDGRHFTAKLIGLDKPSDVALIQVKASNITSLPYGDSNKLSVGDYVAAIGNPFGLNQTVTSGIISALGRTTLGIENYENFIQTDAPINPGNSGGALIDMNGKLVGINTAILAPTSGSIGIGFAIPIDMAKRVINQLIEFGDVKRGVLGIGTQDLTPDLANAFNAPNVKGAAIPQVLPSSPAEAAGIKVGDIITSVDNTPVKSASDVINTVGFLRVNSKVKIEILRQNKKLSLDVTLSDPKQRVEKLAKENPFFFGVALKNFTLLSPIHGNIKGVLVVALEQDSKAWQSDLRPGDVITSINQKMISNISELTAAATNAKKTALLNILRGNSAIFLVINSET